MGIISNRRRYAGCCNSPKYDYEVEYLESGGECYISIGIFINGTLEYAAKFTYTAKNTSYFGGRIARNNGAYLIKNENNSTDSFGYGNISPYTFSFPSNGIVESSYVGTTFKISNRTINVPRQTFNTNIEFWLFGANNYSLTSAGTRIYYFKLWNAGNLVRDLIPVVKDNVGYMYDKVSGQLFGNAGTGDFILGPDKGSAVIITQQQQREMYGE